MSNQSKTISGVATGTDTLVETEQISSFARRATKHTGSVKGSVDHVDKNKLFGCAWDHSDFRRKIEVDIYAGKVYLGQVVANRNRTDLALAGVGDGDHAFEFDLPANVDVGTIRAIVSEGRAELMHGPFFRPRDLVLATEVALENDVVELQIISNIVSDVRRILGRVETKLDISEERAKHLATKDELAKAHNIVLNANKEIQERTIEISKADHRVEGFLEVQFLKFLKKEINTDEIFEEILKIKKSINKNITYSLLLFIFTIFLFSFWITPLGGWVKQLLHYLGAIFSLNGF